MIVIDASGVAAYKRTYEYISVCNEPEETGSNWPQQTSSIIRINVSPKSAIDVNDWIWVSAARQFAISHVFMHYGKKVTGCVSVLTVTSGRSATLWFYSFAGLSPNAIVSEFFFFQTWVNGKLDSASRLIKKHGVDKVSIYSSFTSSILILSCSKFICVLVDWNVGTSLVGHVACKCMQTYCIWNTDCVACRKIKRWGHTISLSLSFLSL